MADSVMPSGRSQPSIQNTGANTPTSGTKKCCFCIPIPTRSTKSEFERTQEIQTEADQSKTLGKSLVKEHL